MFLALRELVHARLRYLLIATVIALVAWLVFLLSGLANGLATDNGASLERMDADYLLFQEDVRLFLHRSILPIEAVDEALAINGVTDATPLGHLTITTTPVNSTDKIDATVLAIDPNGFLAPGLDSGEMFSPDDPGNVVVDATFQRYGVSLGDELRIEPSGEILTVAGFTSNQKYNHLPVVFMSIPRWQSIKYAAEGSSGAIENPISAVAVQSNGISTGDLERGVSGTEAATRQEAIQNLPGYSAEMGTVTLILIFLFLIASLVLAAFFYVITLQKAQEIGILKALGANMGFLARDLIGQVTIISIAGIAIGAALTYLVAAMIPADVPFALSNSRVLLYSGVLLVVSLAGMFLSLIRMSRVDALIAIGRTG